MFESAELGHTLAKTAFERQLPRLRKSLLDAQFDLLQDAPASVVILIHGMDGGGKGDSINTLNSWMDARHILTIGIDGPTDEEQLHAHMWRFWRLLPPKGKSALFAGSWYGETLSPRKKGKARLERTLERILRFERMLAQEGVLVLKFWLHLSKAQQRARFKMLERSKKTRWRVTKLDWKNHARYDAFHAQAEHVLRATDAPHAPWVVVDGDDARYRNFTVAKTILQAVTARLKQNTNAQASDAPPPVALAPTRDTALLDHLVLAQHLPRGDYDQELERYQGKLNQLSREAKFRNISVVTVMEGVDAAGKGGAIRRITAALDARIFRVVPTAAPTDEERAHPYLWRFWRHAPQCGQVVIFDRSWYGRVLVERVEGFASNAEWLRAYGEINDFEEELAEGGAIIAKYWLQIGHAEQLARFDAREKTGYKKYKITPEDWRNRAKWDDYQRAVCDMVDHTSTQLAPWVLVEAENKYYARIKILKDLCQRIEAKL